MSKSDVSDDDDDHGHDDAFVTYFKPRCLNCKFQGLMSPTMMMMSMMMVMTMMMKSIIIHKISKPGTKKAL